MSTKDGGSAFPEVTTETRGMPGSSWQAVKSVGGMSLRDYFAAHAPETPEKWWGGQRDAEAVIAWRWSYADAMLKARQS